MRIGEVADATGVSSSTLRYYEGEGLLAAPRRTTGGYRDYDSLSVERVSFIKQAQSAGLTLRQISEVLELHDGGAAPCGHVATLVEARLAQVEDRLREMRVIQSSLRSLRSRLADLDPQDCMDAQTVCVAIPAS
jgi:DNA-binding transcriptional MerR regulator